MKIMLKELKEILNKGLMEDNTTLYQIENINRDRNYKKEPSGNFRVQKYNNGKEEFTRRAQQ